MSKTKIEAHLKPLKVLAKWNWRCNFAHFLNFKIYFLEFPWEIVSKQQFTSLALRKCKNDYKIPNGILAQGFSPLIAEPAQCLNVFRLLNWLQAFS